MRRSLLCLMALLAVAACGDPLRDVPRLADVEVAEDAGQADALGGPAPESIAEEAPIVQPDTQSKPRGGLLGFLRGRADAAKAAPPEEPRRAPQQAFPAAPADPEGDGAADLVMAAAPAPEPAPPPQQAERQSGTGVLGGLFGGGANRGAASAAPPRAAKGPKPGAPDYEQVGPGVTLPYGKIARLCGVSASKLGRKSASYPERGRGYTLYDTDPGSTAPHTFFLTGFDDGCARQITAALVLFGSPEVYEQIRYSPAGATQPVSDTDRAYEQVKSRVCRVPRGKPCGDKIARLSRDTVFVSVYERFGGAAQWKNLLLHDGEVVALDLKQ